MKNLLALVKLLTTIAILTFSQYTSANERVVPRNAIAVEPVGSPPYFVEERRISINRSQPSNYYYCRGRNSTNYTQCQIFEQFDRNDYHLLHSSLKNTSILSDRHQKTEKAIQALTAQVGELTKLLSEKYETRLDQVEASFLDRIDAIVEDPALIQQLKDELIPLLREELNEG